MRFYAHLAALAAVLIGHNANASPDYRPRTEEEPNIVPYVPTRYQGYLPRPVAAMKDSMIKTQKTLEGYKSRRAQRPPDEEDENVNHFIEFFRQDLAKDFEVTEKQGKDVSQCRRTQELRINGTLRHHHVLVNACLKKNRPSIPVDLKILLLVWTGRVLAQDLNEFPQKCNSNTLTECSRKLESDVEGWRLEVAALMNDEPHAELEEAEIVSHCRNLLFNEFEERMDSVGKVLRQCIATLSPRG